MKFLIGLFPAQFELYLRSSNRLACTDITTDFKRKFGESASQKGNN